MVFSYLLALFPDFLKHSLGVISVQPKAGLGFLGTKVFFESYLLEFLERRFHAAEPLDARLHQLLDVAFALTKCIRLELMHFEVATCMRVES